MTTVTTETAVNETVAPVAVNETVSPVAVNETVAPVAPAAEHSVEANETVSPVAEKVKVSKALEKIADADCSFEHNPLREIFKKDPAGLAKANANGPLSYGWMTEKHDTLSDNVLKQVFSSVNCQMATVIIPPEFMAEFSELANRCNQRSLDLISDMAEAATLEKGSKKVEAEAAKAQKAIEKEAKAAQKVIDDAAKKAKKEAAAAKAKEEEAAVAPTIASDTLDISGLFVGEETVAPVAVTPVIEADPILAAAMAAAQVNANVQAYADAPITESVSTEAPVAMAAE